VQLLPDYEIDFIHSLSPCSFVVSFNDSSNTDSGPTSQWLWSFGDGTFDTIPDPVHTYLAPGTYTVTLVATSSRGCSETLVKTIVIPPYLNATASTASVSCRDSCNGSSTVAVSNGTLPFTYAWNDPLFQNTVTATGLCPGTYQVIVTDSNGCVDTTQTIIGNPELLVATISSTDAYCGGACIGTATITPSGGTPSYFVTWNDPQSQTTLTATGLCPGWYYAQLTDVNGCPVADSVEVLFSNYIPPVDAIVSSDTIFSGQSINLNTITVGGPYSYNWTPPASVSNPQIANPNSSPDEPITYYVTITDSSGCENLDSVSVFVKEVFCEEPEIFIPNAFTPNGDQNNDKVYVRGNTIRELTFKVFDRWGELVFETTSPKQGWDGTYKGKAATPAVYVYWLEAVCYNEEKFFKKGNITLIR
jgi:gliding motility-associated-like protein